MKNEILALFTSVILHHELNIGYYLRKVTGTRISKPIKPLDCFPCFTFWISLPFGLFLNDLYLPLTTFLIAKIYDTIAK